MAWVIIAWHRKGEIDESVPSKRQKNEDELQIENNTLYFVVATKRENTQGGKTVALKRENTQGGSEA